MHFKYQILILMNDFKVDVNHKFIQKNLNNSIITQIQYNYSEYKFIDKNNFAFHLLNQK